MTLLHFSEMGASGDKQDVARFKYMDLQQVQVPEVREDGEAAAVRDNQAEIDEQLTPLLRAMVRCAALAVAVPFK